MLAKEHPDRWAGWTGENLAARLKATLGIEPAVPAISTGGQTTRCLIRGRATFVGDLPRGSLRRVCPEFGDPLVYAQLDGDALNRSFHYASCTLGGEEMFAGPLLV